MASADESEGELIRRAKSGDRDAFDELVRRDIGHAKRLAWRLTGNECDAEDIVAVTYLKAWRALPRFNEDSRFATWRSRIAINVYKDWLRGKTSRHESSLDRGPEDEGPDPNQIPDPEPDPSAQAEAADEQARRAAMIRAALADLNPAYRLLLRLRHEHGMSYEEVLDYIEALLADPEVAGAEAGKEGLSAQQLARLHDEICYRHTADPKERKRQRNAFDLKLLHAREALLKACKKRGYQP